MIIYVIKLLFNYSFFELTLNKSLSYEIEYGCLEITRGCSSSIIELNMKIRYSPLFKSFISCGINWNANNIFISNELLNICN